MQIDGKEALVFLYTQENEAPPTVAGSEAYLDCLTSTFNATVVGNSTFDSYVENVLLNPTIYDNIPHLSQNLGDLWVHGIQTDPFKIGTFREADRTLLRLINDPNVNVSANDNEYQWYVRKLLKAIEHNGGRAGSRCGGSILTSSEVLSHIDTFSDDINEWDSQRYFTYPPLSEQDAPIHISDQWLSIFKNLSNTFNTTFKPIQSDVLGSFHSHNNNINDNNSGTDGKNDIDDNFKLNSNQTCGNWEFSINENGAFTYLKNLQTCQVFATQEFEFGNLIFNSFDSSTGLPLGSGTRCPYKSCSYIIEYDLSNFYFNNYNKVTSGNDSVCNIGLTFKRALNTSVNGYELGAPNITVLNVTLYQDRFSYQIYWFDKPPSCIIESFSLQFNLPFDDSNKNEIKPIVNSIGYDVDVSNSFNNTVSRYHGVDHGVTIVNTSDSINDYFVKLEVIDSAFVVFGDLNELVEQQGNALTKPDTFGKVNVMLYNNWWSQAFPQWYDLDLISRIDAYFGLKSNFCNTTK